MEERWFEYRSFAAGCGLISNPHVLDFQVRLTEGSNHAPASTFYDLFEKR